MVAPGSPAASKRRGQQTGKAGLPLRRFCLLLLLFILVLPFLPHLVFLILILFCNQFLLSCSSSSFSCPLIPLLSPVSLPPPPPLSSFHSTAFLYCHPSFLSCIFISIHSHNFCLLPKFLSPWLPSFNPLPALLQLHLIHS